MSNTNNTNTTKALLKDIAKIEDGEKMKTEITHQMCEHFGEALKELTAEEIDEMARAVRDKVQYKPILDQIDKVAESVADKVLFNPTDTRWLADKAVDVLTTAVGLGGFVWAASKLGINPMNVVVDPLPEASRAAESPFADSSESPSVKVGRSRSNVLPFDRKAS